MDTSPESRSGRKIVFGLIVVALAFGVAYAVKIFLKPELEEAAKEELLKKTSDGREYATVIKIGHDDFPSYALLRSAEMQIGMDRLDTRLYFVDDKGDYKTRLTAIQSGELDMAVFTIDADLVTGDVLGEFPGAIVMVIDKSNGADGIVAFKSAVPNADALNRSGVKIVALADSPSETIARHLVAGALPAIREEAWLMTTGSQEETLERLRKTDRRTIQGFALWEPYLSMALEIPGVHVVYNSSMVAGTIVDVLMVNRTFLDANASLVQNVLESYFDVLDQTSTLEGGLAELVIRDGRVYDKSLSQVQADKIVDGIMWANAMENYAMFGLLPRDQSQGIPHIRMTIDQIGKFLIKTGKLAKNPVEGKEEVLFTSDILSRMQRAGYRPASGQIEQVRGRKTLPKLTDEQWTRLIYVANLDAVEIGFRPASAGLTASANRLIQEIIDQLENWPKFYVEVTGRAMAGGDVDANQKLAADRAQAVTSALIAKGVNPNRLRSLAEPQANHGLGRSVTFRLMQKSF